MKKYLIIALTLALSGCGALQPQIEARPMIGTAYIEVLLDKYLKSNELVTKKSAYEAETDAVKKKTIRDQVANDLLLISDHLYHEFKTELFSNRALKDTTIQILDLALTGTAAVSGGAHAKSNMAAFSTFLKGSNTAIDKNYYAEQTIGSLINIMDGERASTKTELITGLNSDAATFGFEKAIRLVSEYHEKGSVLEAILVISRDAGEKSKAQLTELSTQMKTLKLR
jgi:hypothetical protein